MISHSFITVDTPVVSASVIIRKMASLEVGLVIRGPPKQASR